MTVTGTPRRGSVAVRRLGYIVAATCNAALLYLTLVRPGWRAVPFFTEQTSQVLGIFTVSLVAGLACNLLYLAYDARWLTALGNLATAAIGLALLVQVWRVFPFDFTGFSVDWAQVVRVLLAVATVGTLIGVITGVVSLASAARFSARRRAARAAGAPSVRR
jgi:hypothetical protein